MLDLIQKTISGIPSREAKVHHTRELLQLLVLKTLYDRGYFMNLAFVGGTALRFLYDLRRFSEDLDFSLIRKDSYRFEVLVGKVLYDLRKSGVSVETKPRVKGSVQSAMLKFKDVLQQLSLSTQRSEKLLIKIEVDANPPQGWNTEMSLVSRHYVFTVTHFDIPSLYATKLHACFFRRYTKGRDFYDLLWFLGKKILPNLELLNNAIGQTEQKRMNVDADNFNDFLRKRLAKVDFVRVRKDVGRFIEDKGELKLLDGDLVSRLI